MNKIVLLAPTPPPFGGIAQWTSRMLNIDFGEEWKISVVDEKIIGKRDFFGDRKRINFFNEIKRCRNIWHGLKKELKDGDAKVVHSCIAANTLPIIREYICAKITKKRKKKFIIHFRCTVPNIVKNKVNLYWLKRICEISDMIFSLNIQTSIFLEKITKTPIRLIPNFIDNSEIVTSRLINEELKTVLYVGGVTKEKGCLDIVKVAALFPELSFRLVGKPEQDVVTVASNYKNVCIVGPKSHKDIIEEYSNADLFLFLSHFAGEGFSNALLEAMASGLPCVVSDWAANSDMIGTDGGIVVKSNSAEEVKSAIDFFASKSNREFASERNIRITKQYYSNNVVVNQYLKFYKELIEDKK